MLKACESVMKHYRKNSEAKKAYSLRRYYEVPYLRLVSAAARRAKLNGVECTINVAWAREKWTGKCELTGIDFVSGKRGISQFSPSIDRINPAIGYTPENCRFILARVNFLKGTDSDDAAIYRIAEALISNKAKR